MKGRAFVLCVGLASVAQPGSAAEVDFSIRAGATLPFYEQTFPIALDVPPVPGVTIRQEGGLALKARGGPLIGVGVRFWPGRRLGLEARYDSGAVASSVEEPVFLVGVDLGPFGHSPDVAVSPHTTLDVGRLTPLSLNLALRNRGRARVVVSGGLSYLPSMTFAAREELSIDLVVLDLDLPALVAGGKIPSRVGGNVGLAIELPLSRTVAFQVEGRVFAFQGETLDWNESQLAGVGPVEALLVDAIRGSLDPVEFTPGFFHLAAGVVLRF